MGSLHLLDEREQPLPDFSQGWIREGIEYEGIHLGVHQGVGGIWLHLALAAHAETEELDSCVPGEYRWICHSGPSAGHAVRIAGTVDPDPVPERFRRRLQYGTFIYTDLQAFDFAVEREVHQALVHLPVKVRGQDERLVMLTLGGTCGSRPKPLAVFLDVEVEAPVCQHVGGDTIIKLAVFRLQHDGRTVGPEHDGYPGCAADLEVLGLRPSFVLDRVHTRVRDWSIEQFSDYGKIGSLRESVLLVAWGNVLCRGRQHRERQHQCECERFHDAKL